MLSENPAKRAVEKFWLAYAPVWGTVCAVVMMGGFAERWGDAALLSFGAVVALPACVGPLFLASSEERRLPFHRRVGFKLSLSVTAFAVLLNYSQTPFFFDVLHMHFGFRSTLNIQHNPVFLYLLTIAYFSTYAVLLMMAYRFSQRLLSRAPRAIGMLAGGLACVVVAGLETLLNANPFMHRLYCFDDMGFAMWFGSLAYGISFVCVLPAWIALDERPGVLLPWTHALVFVCAAVYVDGLALDALRHHVAPRFTQVHEGANGLMDFGDSCLGR